MRKAKTSSTLGAGTLSGSSPLAALQGWASQTPQRLFWTFAAAHLILWTLLPSISCPNAPLDVIEGYAWGHEWLMGTYKHPPMQAWWLGAIAYLSDRASWGHFLASQIAVILAFWAVWQTGRRMFTEQAALLGVLLLEGVVYYNFISTEFNPNVLQLAFWALIGNTFHRAIKENRVIDWLLLGVWSAAGLYSKYSTALLLLVLGILMLVRPEGRRHLRSLGPYLAAVVGLLLFLPQIAWLFNNAFLPFTYAWDRMQTNPNAGFITSSVRAPFFYILSQLLAVLPATVLFFAFCDRGSLPKDKRFRSFDRDFLDFVTFGPFLLTLLMAILIGIKIHDMWAMPFWNFLGLWAIARFRAVFSKEALRRFISGWIAVCLASVLLYTACTVYSPYVTHRGLRVQFPGKPLAEKIDAAWHKRFQSPLQYVVGDTWPAGNVAFYTPEWPHVLIKGDYAISPWISPDSVRRFGGVAVWCIQSCAYKNYEEGEPPYIRNFPHAEIQEPLTLPRQTEADVPPTRLGWAILPPAG
ncbi:MAG: glycosyltransferase family 39 protein [Pseudomonadota bacterium]|nr:glycosyltransferase family 39 protein [Pseudomonadota bacterium]